MFYVNSFINLMDSIAIYILDFLSSNRALFIAIVVAIFTIRLMVLICMDIIDAIKPTKNTKSPDTEILRIANKYYKNKYQEKLNTYTLKLDRLWDTKNSCSGYVYINDNKSKYIYVTLNSKFESDGIYDNIEDDIIVRDIKSILSKNIKYKYNANCFTRLNKVPCTLKPYRYTTIYEYFNKNLHIKPNIFIVHKIEDDDFDSYCNKFARELYISLRENLNGIDINLVIYFTKNEEIYNNLTKVITKWENFNDSLLISFLEETENRLIKKDNYCYFVFDN